MKRLRVATGREDGPILGCRGPGTGSQRLMCHEGFLQQAEWEAPASLEARPSCLILWSMLSYSVRHHQIPQNDRTDML
jgi:hypothetical protein